MTVTKPRDVPRAARTGWVVVGSVIAVASVLVVALNIVDWFARHQVVATDSFAGISQVEIGIRSGDVRIVAADTDQVTVTAESRYGLWPARHDWVSDGEVLTVGGGCPVIALGDCSTDLLVVVPPGTGVGVHTSHGRTTIAGVDGPVSASSSSGDIVAERLSGTVDLDSSHGDIRATGITATLVQARAVSGDILLQFASEPDLVFVDSRYGSSEIVVPDSPVSYRVDLTSEHGETRSSVNTDSAAERSITARAVSGDITVRHS